MLPILFEQEPNYLSRLVVVVRVNTECSLSCSYCAYSREYSKSKNAIRSTSINLQTLKSLGESLQKHRQQSNQPVLISWLGGEPFQWDHWYEQTSRFVDQLGLEASITTNGLALRSRLVRQRALRLFSEITVSLDGLPIYHDEIRKCPGLFERVKRSILDLVSERQSETPRLRVNCVLTRHNVDDFPDFCQTLADLGIDELTYNGLGGNDRPEFFQDNRLRPVDVDALESFLPSIRKDCPTLVVRGSEHYFERLRATSLNQPIAVRDCQPGQRFLFVDEQGQIAPCSFTPKLLGIHIKELSPYPVSAWEQIFRNRLCQNQPKCCFDCQATHVFSKFDLADVVVENRFAASEFRGTAAERPIAKSFTKCHNSRS